jgi:pyrroline-5-carboxylate reductase
MKQKQKRPATKKKPMQTKKAASSFAVGFIGAGNMATALIQGLVAAGLYEKSQICASDVDAGRRSIAKRKLGVTVTTDNAFVAQHSRTIVLAVKPQIIVEVMAELSRVASSRHLFVSIMAGVPTARLEAGLGGSARVVRVMPNTPALLGKGMAVVVRGRHATAADERLALRLLRSVGEARAVADEALLDPVTGLSGSGPAYVYLFAEALIAGGTAAGLSQDLSRDLALQTITGAAAMLQQSGETPQRLREMVTSPGGTTLAGLTELDRRGFVAGVSAAIVAATRRSVELGRG